ALLSEHDRTWWRLDGTQKAYSRKRDALCDVMNRQLRLLREALGNLDRDTDRQREDIDRRFLKDLSLLRIDPERRGEDVFITMHRGRPTAGATDADTETSDANPWLAPLNRYEEDYGALEAQSGQRRKIREAIHIVTNHHEHRMRLLEGQFEPILSEL